MSLTLPNPIPQNANNREIILSDEELVKIYPLLEPGVMLGVTGDSCSVWNGEDHLYSIRPRLGNKLGSLHWLTIASDRNGFDCSGNERHNTFYTLIPEAKTILSEHRDSDRCAINFRMHRAVRRLLDIDRSDP